MSAAEESVAASTEASKTIKNEPTWIPIESDPEILTQLVRMITFTDHYLLDVPILHGAEEMGLFAGHTVKGFIFLYEINEKTRAEVATSAGAPDPPTDLFFMRQLIRNSCATVAIIHAYMNSVGGDHETASLIKAFANEVKASESSPQKIGELFAANKAFKDLHLEHAILGQSGVPTGSDALANVNYHYVALVGREGVLYRLDGRCEKPLPMGEYVEDDEDKVEKAEDEEGKLSFIGASIQALSSLIARDPDNYNFSVLAFCAPKASGTK